MIPIFEPVLDGNEALFLANCIETGWISSQGEYIGAFENAFATFHGMPHAVATSSCTTALHLALVALGIGAGDEVLCPDLTFIAPANMIRLAGATPVLVDVEKDSWAIDPEFLRRQISPRTRAILVVHPFGHVADMAAVMAIAEEFGLKVIEDNAESPGATFNGQLAGTFGDASCFSFFANKILTTGEGGMVLCRDADLEQRLRVLRDHGMSRQQRYVHNVVGFNYRMTNMQAAVGAAQLERFSDILDRRATQEAHYRARFAESGVFAWRPAVDGCHPVHWLATVTLAKRELRPRFLDHMLKNGIDCRQMVYPVHEAKPYRDDNVPAAFPVATDIAHRSAHLPSGTGLTADQIDRICDIANQFAAGIREDCA